VDSHREKNILRKLALTSGILAIALFISAWFSEETSQETMDLKGISLRAETNLQNLESSALNAADTILSMEGKEQMMSFFSQNKPGGQKITFLVYEKGKLLAWSGSDVTFASIEDVLTAGKKFIRLPNGWYRILTKEKANRRAVIFISVYSDYSYQNRFLVNGFSPALRIPAGISLSDKSSKYAIHDSHGEPLFTISRRVSTSSEEKFPFPELLETLAIALLLFALLCYGRILLYRSLPGALVFSAAIICARIAMHVFQFPNPLYQTALFSPEQYASSFFFDSPGALLFNVLCVLVVALIFFRHQKILELYATKRFSATRAVLHLFCISALLILSFAAVRYYAGGLIINSKISFDLSNILELNWFSVLGFFMLALLMGFCLYYFPLRFRSYSSFRTAAGKK
jgi:two-component system nitrogen regulation sensor histidine kinase NtrY